MKTFLLLIFLGCLTSCLGVSGPAGNPASGPEGGAVDTTLARPESAQDVAQADSGKPHPGGISAPSNQWPGPSFTMEWSVGGTVQPQCLMTDEYQRADGTTLTDQRVRTWITGKIVERTNGELLVQENDAFYWLRITEGEGESLRCYDVLVNYRKDFSQSIEPADPSSLHYYVSLWWGANSISAGLHKQPCSAEAIAKSFVEFTDVDIAVVKPPADPMKECVARARKTTPPSGDNPMDLGISVPVKPY